MPSSSSPRRLPIIGDVLYLWLYLVQEWLQNTISITKRKRFSRSTPLYALREAFSANAEVATNHAGRLTVWIIGDVYAISAVYVNSYYQLSAMRNVLSAKRMNE